MKRKRISDTRKVSGDTNDKKNKKNNTQEEEKILKKLRSGQERIEGENILRDWNEYEQHLNELIFERGPLSGLMTIPSDRYNEWVSFYQRYRKYLGKQHMRNESQYEQIMKSVSKIQLQKYKEHTQCPDYMHLCFFFSKGPTIQPLLEKQQYEAIHYVFLLFLQFITEKERSEREGIRKKRENLPIFNFKEQIIHSVLKHQVTIIAGDTGCGKSTQVPQYLLEASDQQGNDSLCPIAVTQPRRISTMSLSRRVAYEQFCEYGTKIAYQIRFDSSKDKNTQILFLTEGVILRQLISDPLLERYKTIIVDEVHERHETGDFLLGLLKLLIHKRKDVKIILMSATINISLFQTYFEDCDQTCNIIKPIPIINVPGRLFPIEIEYLPVKEVMDNSKCSFVSFDGEEIISKEMEQIPGGLSVSAASAREIINTEPYIQLLHRIDQNYENQPGDVLIFLSGINEIVKLYDDLRNYAIHTKSWIILKLHSSIPVEDQEKVFDKAPANTRKCILSTNIAETAVTIDGIRFVIDSGKVKEMSFNSETKVKILQEFWISKASAEQRKGRAGRTGPGVCFRLYSKQDLETFDPYPVPEMQRIPLENIILQIKFMLPNEDPRCFPFIEPPSIDSLEHSILQLKYFEAMSSFDEALSPLGKILSKLPVDVQIGKILVLGATFDILDPVLTIAAMLSVQHPFIRIKNTNNYPSRILQLRHEFDSMEGDAFTLLNLFHSWIEVKRKNRNSSKQWCKEHLVEEQRLYEAAKLKQQFKDLLADVGFNAQNPKNNQERKEKFKDLHKIRRTLQFQQEKNIGKRVLKWEDFEEDKFSLDNYDEKDSSVQNELEDQSIDIRHIDFVISCDVEDFYQQSKKNLSAKDINLIKFILSFGFYPNIAFEDETNLNRKGTEQVYHTKSKSFLLMHPTSIFYGKQINFSQDLQLLCYQSLLQTNSTYLLNSFRIPSLQILFLFAKCIDTDISCRRVLVDHWIEIHFLQPQLCIRMLTVSHQLRTLLKGLLRKRLDPLSCQTKTPKPISKNQVPKNNLPKWIIKITKETEETYQDAGDSSSLARKLADFLQISIDSQSLIISRKVLNQVVNMFVEKNNLKEHETLDAMKQLEESLPFQTEESLKSLKGGTEVNDYLRFGSIVCDLNANIQDGLKKNHESSSNMRAPIAATNQNVEVSRNQNISTSKHLLNRFDCPVCKKTYWFNYEQLHLHIKHCSSN